jgi:hypothetical protein
LARASSAAASCASNVARSSGLLPPGILAKLGQLPVHAVAVRPGRLGGLLYPGRALLGGLGARLSVVGPVPRRTDSLVPLLLRGGHSLLSGPLRPAPTAHGAS